MKTKKLIKTKLTDDSRHAVASGLHIAADQFERDAVNMAKTGQHRLAAQFRRQENETRVLAILFENSDGAEVTTEGPEEDA